MQPTNFFADIPIPLHAELFTTLLEAADLRIERIVSHGHASPEGFWYDRDRHECIVVLKGAARLRFDDATVGMKPGDFVNIPAHKKHRLEWTTRMNRRSGWRSSAERDALECTRMDGTCPNSALVFCSIDGDTESHSISAKTPW